MKKTIVLMLALALLLTGCVQGKRPEAKRVETPEETKLSNEVSEETQSAPAVDYENLVSTAYSDVLTPNEWMEVHVEIPQINLDIPKIAELNEYIMNKYYNLATGTAPDGMPQYMGVSYAWNYREDLLSLVVSAYYPYSEGAELEIFNILLPEGIQVADLMVYPMFDTTQEEFQTNLRMTLAADWMKTVENAGDSAEWVDPEQDSYAAQQYQNTIAWGNVADAVPFVGENGSLWALCRVYSVAGADWYWRTIEIVENPELPENWEQLGTDLW